MRFSYAQHMDHDLQEALAWFKKLHKMLPDNHEVVWQIAMCHDMDGNLPEVRVFHLGSRW